MPKLNRKQNTILVGAALVATLITGAITSIVVIRKQNRDADVALFVDALSGTSAATDAFEAGFNGN